MPKRRLNSTWTLPNILGKLLVYLYAVVVLVPLYFVIITAFKTGTEITLHPLALPEHFMWSNVRDAFAQGSLLQAMGNSVLTSVTGVLMLMFNAVVLSFCVHRLRNHKLGTLLYVIILMGLFIPKVGFVSQIMLYRRLHIYDTPWAIILGAAVGNIPFSVFIIAGFLRTVPRELEEAAELDGCNDFQLLFRIMVPIIKPALVTIGIFSFTGTWNSVTGPLLFIRSKELFTIPMALLTFNSTYSTQYELLFAGILVTGLPLVIAYLFCQKYFAQALTGSVKG
ncbi:MAG: carbohydrate ABC transporter permease [Candidatus Avoscillospira sp.]